MKRDNESEPRGSFAAGFVSAIVGAFIALMLATSVATAMSSEQEKYDPLEAGHPLRIAAYVLHPVGVIIDRLILRPAYWLGSHEPIKTLVGRTD